MFLNRFNRALVQVRRNDQGAVLAAAIGVMSVGMLVTTLIATTVVAGAGKSTATRAGIQSEAAAEAGISAARAIVDSSTCAAGGTTLASTAGAAQTYSVSIAWRKGTSGAWTAGCPSSKRYQVKYVSTGTAAAKAVASQSSDDVSRVEAIYGATTVSTTVTGTGAAIYAYGSTGDTGLGNGIGLLNALTVGGPKATVQVRHGDASCGGLNLTSNADWMVQDGSFTQSGACVAITGNVSASGSVTMTPNTPVLGATITGNVSAGTLSMGTLLATSRITGNAWVTGASSFDSILLLKPTITGTLTTKTKTGSVNTGTTTVVAAGPGASPYVTVAVPNWVDYDFTGQPGWPGFTIKALNSSTCTSAGVTAAITALGASKGVIDAQACTDPSMLSNLSIGALNNDLAFILPNTLTMQLGGITVTAGSHKLWFIQPDNDVTDGVPTCPSGGGLTTSGVSLATPQIMIYTPCTYTETGLISAAIFTGQIYAGKANLGGALVSARVQNYTQVGIPGVDLTAGTTTTTGPRMLLSSRDVQAG